MQVQSFGTLLRDMAQSLDPRLLALYKKHFVHNNYHAAFRNASEGRKILLEAQQMSKYRIKSSYMDRCTLCGTYY